MFSCTRSDVFAYSGGTRYPRLKITALQCSVQVSAGLRSFMIFSVPPGKCRDSVSIKQRPLSSRVANHPSLRHIVTILTTLRNDPQIHPFLKGRRHASYKVTTLCGALWPAFPFQLEAIRPIKQHWHGYCAIKRHPSNYFILSYTR
jgi:hypothetical protein